MNIDDVLLTRDELQDAFDAGYKGETGGKRCRNAETSQNKAQCLKLLEWGLDDCVEHPGEVRFQRRFDCPKCKAELRAELKEG